MNSNVSGIIVKCFVSLEMGCLFLGNRNKKFEVYYTEARILKTKLI
jgi:hypothetical protein